MKIALDYDKTFNLDREFWSMFEILAHKYSHEVRIVTARSPKNDKLTKEQTCDIPIIYCDGIAKKFYCHWFADDGKGWDPDVWIDDKPEGINNNSGATREVLAEWRASEEYNR